MSNFKEGIKRLIIQETGTYNPMFQRAFETNLDGSSLNTIIDRVQQSPSCMVSAGDMTGLSSNFLSPSATPGADIYIPNNWQERRIRFLLEYHVEMRTGAYMIYYIQGYTDYPGVGMNGAVDPNMEFIVNSILGVSRTNMMTPMGVQVIDKVVESCQVVVDPNWSQSLQADGSKRIMRPTDVFVGMQSANMEHSYSYLDNANIVDYRTTLKRDPIRSNRSNNISTNFMSKVLNSYNNACALSQLGQGRDDILTNSRANITEAPMMENPFIRRISDLNGGMGISNRFKIGTLMTIDANLPHVTDFLVPTQAEKVNIHTAGSTAYWNGSDMTTKIATVLSQAVPALMMELMISNITFRSTNMDIGGLMNTMIINARSMMNLDMTRNFEAFRMRFEREVMFDLTFGNQEIYALDMSVDMFGESWISIQFSSEPATQFTAPSFCDNLYTPIVLQNSNQFGKVVHDFEYLLNNVADAIGSKTNLAYNPGV